MDKEIWRPIGGYENRYEVSNWGRVKSLDRYSVGRNNSQRLIKGKILNPSKSTQGYLFVGLNKDATRKLCSIHRLVAQTFILNPENNPDVNHIDGDKTNNNVENLEWVTKSENLQHAYNSNLKTANKGDQNYNSKLTNEQVRQIRKEYVPYSKTHNTYVLAKKYNVSRLTIHFIINNKTYRDSNCTFEKYRFTPKQIKKIRKEYIPYSKTNSTIALAKKYGVSPSRIWEIINNKTYKNID